MVKKEFSTGKLSYKLTNDYLFHIVFQKNEKILRNLIKSLLSLKDEEIIDIRLENPIHPGDNVDDKSIIMDILITLNNDRKINIEMQVTNYNDWPERSLYYTCKAFTELEVGKDYSDIMPVVHIGILDFTLFPDIPEFYARYAFKNIINNNIYSDKLRINVLDLTQTELATSEDINSGLQYWARLFKAETWEEIRMLQSEYNDFADIEETMQTALNDKKIRMQCEARERYERDKLSAYSAGEKAGHELGYSEGHESGLIEGAIKTGKFLGFDKVKTKENIIGQFSITPEKADEYLELYW